jgi:hypothetical protein
MCRDAAAGEYAVHKQSVLYLPKLIDEEVEAYKTRLKMTPFFNATWRTITGLRGMLFRKPPTADVPSAFATMMEDIDRAGTTMVGLSQEVVEEALVVGRVGLLVDYPAAPIGATRADASAMGLRSMISVYEAESIYNWKESTTNGARRLVQVRLSEDCDVECEDEFEDKCEKRYRILDLFNGMYRQRIYRVTEKDEEVQVGEDVFPLMNGAPLDFIPFVFIGVDCVGPDVDAPPLIDLVTTNLHHYLQATSYERGCFFSGLPTMFISGMEDTDKDISIGGTVANLLASPNAKAYYVEVSSKFEALRTNLEDKKKEMAVLGARMLEGGKGAGGPEAAETVARRQSGEESVLSSMSQTISQGLTRALSWMALWEGIATPVVYTLNRDFLPTVMDPAELTALVAAWQNGAISQQTLFQSLKDGEIIDSNTTFEEEQGRIDSAMVMAQSLMAQMAPPNVDAAEGAPPPPPQGTGNAG